MQASDFICLGDFRLQVVCVCSQAAALFEPCLCIFGSFEFPLVAPRTPGGIFWTHVSVFTCRVHHNSFSLPDARKSKNSLQALDLQKQSDRGWSFYLLFSDSCQMRKVVVLNHFSLLHIANFFIVPPDEVNWDMWGPQP